MHGPTDSLSAPQVREHLQRVLESDAFEGATRSRLLLEYCVLRALEGKTEELHEARLSAVLLGDKTKSLRRQSAMMRSVSRRMSERLRAHYDIKGRDELLRIEFPGRSYVPVIRPRTEDDLDALPEEPQDAPVAVRHSADPYERGFPWGAVVLTALLSTATLAGLALWDPLDLGFSLSRPRQYGAFRRLTSHTAMSLDPVVSPDGRVIVYASDQGTNGNLSLYQQLAAVGEPVRLTHDDADAHQPSLSEDGNTVVYRSEKDGGGVYQLTISRGETVKVADRGRNPRLSPDGKWIAYWELSLEPDGRDSKLFVAPPGGKPMRLREEFLKTQNPVWSPDSRHLLFVGRPPGSSEVDWWVTPIDGSAPVKTGALTTAPHVLNMRYGPPHHWQKDGSLILFDAFLGETRNIWSVPISSGFRVNRTPSRVTVGVAKESHPVTALDKRLVFSALSVNQRIWSLPLDPLQGKASGEPAPLGKEADGPEYFPTMAYTGGRIGFLSEKAGKPQIFVREPAGVTVSPVPNDSRAWSPLYSRDGTLAYLRTDLRGLTKLLEMIDSAGLKRAVPCDRCERLFAFAPDGKQILVGVLGTPDALRLGVVDITGGQVRILVPDPEVVFAADWSPDGRWIAYSSRTGVVRTQIKAISSFAEEKTRIAITDGSFAADNPRWSADSKLLYYLSEADTYRCLYAVRVATGNGLSTADHWPVHHFHKARQMLQGVPQPVQALAIGQDRALVTLEEIRGTIWMTDPQ